MDQPKSSGTQRAGAGGRPDKQDKPPATTRKEKKEKSKGTGGSSKRNRKGKKDAPPPPTRVIIRRLPPTMTEQLFCEQISIDGKMPEHDEFYFVGPDWSLGQNASCHAYINFTNAEDIFRFTDSFDGYTFVDSKGLAYQAVVEYAPYQKPQKNRSRKKDPKCGTIETDTHFIAFKEALEIEAQEALHGRGTQEFSFKLEQEEKTTTTPLLEYIAQRKQEKRDERRRKQDEKRRMRDEERFMKKTQIAKAIPDAIQEEVFNEFMEQTALPRLNSLQIASKTGGYSGKGADGKPKDEKDKKSRNRKDKRKGDESKGQPEGGKSDGDKNAGSKKQERDKGGKKAKDKGGKDDNVRPKEQNQQQQQQQQKGERNDKPKKDKQFTSASSASTVAEQLSTSKAAQSVPTTGGSTKKEVKKYSERRKETRARAETRFAEQDTRMGPECSKDDASSTTTKADKVDGKKTILTASVPSFIPKEKTTILLTGHSSTATNLPIDLAALSISAPEKPSTKNGKNSPSPDGRNKPTATEKLTEKQREAREARKIRNKDRPSIEIYQPRKRIVSGAGGKSEDDRGRSDSDRPSDNAFASASAGAAAESGGGDAVTKERRHKLTKKSSDQRQKGKNSDRKNSIEYEGGGKTAGGFTAHPGTPLSSNKRPLPLQFCRSANCFNCRSTVSSSFFLSRSDFDFISESIDFLSASRSFSSTTMIVDGCTSEYRFSSFPKSCRYALQSSEMSRSSSCLISAKYFDRSPSRNPGTGSDDANSSNCIRSRLIWSSAPPEICRMSSDRISLEMVVAMCSHAFLQAACATPGSMYEKLWNVLCRKATMSVTKADACPYDSGSTQS
uniref:UPF3 domain-containing protein n=1 Tax=Anopheles farauti TaxID=69004 RepID=A0A182QFI2_9DIPT